MSYKIHDGLRINTTDFQHVFGLLTAFNEVAKQIGLATYSKTVYKLAVRRFDQCTLTGEKEKYSCETHAVVQIMDRQNQIRKMNSRDPFADFDCEISIFPLEDCFLLLVNAEQEEFLEAFKKIEGVEEYAYWNNTDKPDRCTEEEWEHREEVWDKAFGLTGDANFNGLLFKTTGINFQPDPKYFEVASIEKRAKSFAEERLCEEKFDKDKGASQVFSILRDNKDRLAEISEEIVAKLKEEITLEDLTNKDE